MTTVAKRYDVSSNYLARICERLDVPRPPRGYWQQLAAGIKIKASPLPGVKPGGELAWTRDGALPPRAPLSATTPAIGPRTGPRPAQHPLLLGARAHFDHARDPGWQAVGYVRPYKKNLVDVVVSKDMLDRALKVANAFFLLLEERGQRVTLAPNGATAHVTCDQRAGRPGTHDYSEHWTPARPTVTFIGDVAIGLTLFEISEEVDARYDSALSRWVRATAAPPSARRRPQSRHSDWTSRHWLPSGRLGLHAFAPYRGVTWEHYWYETRAGEFSKC
jgi:hypothetical protein